MDQDKERIQSRSGRSCGRFNISKLMSPVTKASDASQWREKRSYTATKRPCSSASSSSSRETSVVKSNVNDDRPQNIPYSSSSENVSQDSDCGDDDFVVLFRPSIVASTATKKQQASQRNDNASESDLNSSGDTEAHSSSEDEDDPILSRSLLEVADRQSRCGRPNANRNHVSAAVVDMSEEPVGYRETFFERWKRSRGKMRVLPTFVCFSKIKPEEKRSAAGKEQPSNTASYRDNSSDEGEADALDARISSVAGMVGTADSEQSSKYCSKLLSDSLIVSHHQDTITIKRLARTISANFKAIRFAVYRNGLKTHEDQLKLMFFMLLEERTSSYVNNIQKIANEPTVYGLPRVRYVCRRKPASVVKKNIAVPTENSHDDDQDDQGKNKQDAEEKDDYPSLCPIPERRKRLIHDINEARSLFFHNYETILPLSFIKRFGPDIIQRALRPT